MILTTMTFHRQARQLRYSTSMTNSISYYEIPGSTRLTAFGGIMTLAPSPETANLRTEPTFEPFLLDPRNRDFFLGSERYIADIRPDWSLYSVLPSVVVISLIIFLFP